jgi:hypothetical protein
MISMTYDQRCETFRFAKRKIRFVLAAFGRLKARSETRALGLVHSIEPAEVAGGKRYATRNHLVLRRREAASKDASGAAKEAASWTILRDAKLRFAP